MRFDSGFWSNKITINLERLGVRFTMAVKTGNPAIAQASATIDADGWTPIDYTPNGYVEVADCTYTSGTGKSRRLDVWLCDAPASLTVNNRNCFPIGVTTRSSPI